MKLSTKLRVKDQVAGFKIASIRKQTIITSRLTLELLQQPNDGFKDIQFLHHNWNIYISKLLMIKAVPKMCGTYLQTHAIYSWPANVNFEERNKIIEKRQQSIQRNLELHLTSAFEIRAWKK